MSYKKYSTGSSATWIPLAIIIIMLVADWANVFDSNGNLNSSKEPVVEIKGEKKYTNKKLKFQMTIPDTWVESFDLSKDTDFGLVDGSFVNEVPVFVSGKYVTKDNLSDDFFEEIVDDSKILYIKYISDQNKGNSPIVISDDKLLIDGLQSRLIVFKSLKNNKNINLEAFRDFEYELFINNNNNGVYVFRGGFDMIDYDLYNNLVQKTLLSFKLLK